MLTVQMHTVIDASQSNFVVTQLSPVFTVLLDISTTSVLGRELICAQLQIDKKVRIKSDSKSLAPSVVPAPYSLLSKLLHYLMALEDYTRWHSLFIIILF